MAKRIWVIVFLTALTAAGAAAQQKIPGQKSMPMIDGTFVFSQGAWANYSLLDKTDNRKSRMLIAILERKMVKRVPFRWIEIEVEMEGEPVVVTRVLVEETLDGPGRMEKAVVQVQGFDPFTIPKKFMEGDDPEVAGFEPARIVRRLEQKTLTLAGKIIDLWEVEAETDSGEVLTALVSTDVPPITLVEAESSDFRMAIIDWGRDAVTRIKGKPKSFTMWILDQIAKEIKK